MHQKNNNTAIPASNSLKAPFAEHAIATSAVAMAFGDIQGRISYVNRAFVDLLGYDSAEEILERLGTEFTPNPERVQEILAALRSRGRWIGEIDARKRDGTLFQVHVSASSVTEAGGEPLCTMASITDLTLRKKAEDRFRQLIAAAPDAMVICNREGAMTLVNSQTENLFGYRHEELLGQPVELLIPEKYRGQHPAHRDAYFANPKVRPMGANLELYGRRKDGSEFPAEISLSPLETDDGPVAIAAIRDVSERRRAEEALRQNQISLEAAQAHAHFGNWEFDPSVGTGFWSAEMFRIFGRDPRLGPPAFDEFLDLIHPDDAASVLAAQERVLASGEPGTLDFRTHPARGLVRHLNVTMRAVEAAPDRPLRLAGTVLDITERKRAEGLIDRRARQQSSLAQLSQYALAGTDLQALMDRAVELIAQTLGVEFCKVLELRPDGRTLLLRAGVGWKSGLVGHAAVSGGQDSQAGFTLQSNAPVVVENLSMEPRFRGPPLLIEHGVVSGMSVVIQGVDGPYGVLGTHSVRQQRFSADDVNFLQAAANVLSNAIARQRADEKIRQSEARLALAQRVARLGSWEADLAQKTLWWSDETYRIFGFSRETSTPASAAFFDCVHPDDRDRVRRTAEEAVATGRTYQTDHRIVRPDGTQRVVRERADVFTDSSGRPARMVGTVQDITELKQIEEQLIHSQKMDAIGQLTGGIAHDFNNLLTVIQGHTSHLLGRGKLGEEESEFVRQIALVAERAAGLTKQLLVFSHKQVIQLRDLDLNDIVTNMAKMLNRILGEDIKLQLEPSANLPLVHADAGMMEQVLLNFAVNSRDAMPKGGRLIVSTHAVALDAEAVLRKSDSTPGLFVCLTVFDTGCGIAPEHLPRIFEPFFTTKEVGKGTGLGLATVYGIVKQHRGWIDLASEVGKGTTFRVYVPAVRRGRIDGSITAPDSPVGAGTETILVVEDQAEVRELARIILEHYGYTVLVAPNGPRALEVWRQNSDRIKLLLTDVVMPEGMNGRELAERLQAERRELKVIYVSGYSAVTLGKGVLLKEGIDFLQKPYRPQELALAVRACLDASPSGIA